MNNSAITQTSTLFFERIFNSYMYVTYECCFKSSLVRRSKLNACGKKMSTTAVILSSYFYFQKSVLDHEDIAREVKKHVDACMERYQEVSYRSNHAQ